jgi:putative transcription factor
MITMSVCEMCGTEGKIVTALVEGVELNVCQKCSAFGKIVHKPKAVLKKTEKKAKMPEREIIQVIREDFSKLIRQKREKLGLKQKEFSKFLSEKESTIHKIESGTYTPSLALARKIEKQLGLSLIEEKEVVPQNLKEKKESYTIGDALKLK